MEERVIRNALNFLERCPMEGKEAAPMIEVVAGLTRLLELAKEDVGDSE